MGSGRGALGQEGRRELHKAVQSRVGVGMFVVTGAGMTYTAGAAARRNTASASTMYPIAGLGAVYTAGD